MHEPERWIQKGWYLDLHNIWKPRSENDERADLDSSSHYFCWRHCQALSCLNNGFPQDIQNHWFHWSTPCWGELVGVNGVEEIPPHLRGWELQGRLNINLTHPECVSREPIQEVCLLPFQCRHINKECQLQEAIAWVDLTWPDSLGTLVSFLPCSLKETMGLQDIWEVRFLPLCPSTCWLLQGWHYSLVNDKKRKMQK